MKRIDMMVAVLTLGTAALTAREASACEHHPAAPRAASDAPAPEPTQAQAAPAHEDTAPVLQAARCQCGSAADCTCKKGTCECPRCKKPRHEQPLPERAERPGASGTPEA
jgi:hypothetical protein